MAGMNRADSRWLRSGLGLLALVGGWCLLVADSAGPDCKDSSFQGVYRIETDCGDGGSELFALEAGGGGSAWSAFDLEHLDGDALLLGASIDGACYDDGATLRAESLTLSLRADAAAGEDAADAGGLEQSASCSLALPLGEARSATCYVETGGNRVGECHLTLSPAERPAPDSANP